MARRGMAAALCAAALVVSGCSDDPPEPKPLDPPTGSETTTAPPTSEPPKAQTPEALIRSWLTAVDEAQASGDTGALRRAFPGCAACTTFADRVDEIYDAGGWVKAPLKKNISIKLREKRSTGRRIYDVTFFAPPWLLKESAKAKAVRQKGGPGTQAMELAQVENDWSLLDIKTVIDGQDA
jgi:hypothetical protein